MMPPLEDRKTPERPSISPITSPGGTSHSDQDQSSNMDIQHDEGNLNGETQSEYEDDSSENYDSVDDAERSEFEHSSPMPIPVFDDSADEDYDESPRPARKTREVAVVPSQTTAASSVDDGNQSGGYVRQTRAQKKAMERALSEGTQGASGTSSAPQAPQATTNDEDESIANKSDDNLPQPARRSTRATIKKPSTTEKQVASDNESISSNSAQISKKQHLIGGRSKATRRNTDRKARNRQKMADGDIRSDLDHKNEGTYLLVSVAVGVPALEIVAAKRFRLSATGGLNNLQHYKKFLPERFARDLVDAGHRGEIEITGVRLQDPQNMDGSHPTSTGWETIGLEQYRAYGQWLTDIKLAAKDMSPFKIPFKVQVLVVDRRVPDVSDDYLDAILSRAYAMNDENTKLKIRINHLTHATSKVWTGYPKLEAELQTTKLKYIKYKQQYVESQKNNDELTKAMGKMALDLEYSGAGYNPKDGLAGEDEAYWTKYLPKATADDTIADPGANKSHDKESAVVDDPELEE